MTAHAGHDDLHRPAMGAQAQSTANARVSSRNASEASQGTYLEQAQAWAARVANNLTGQAEALQQSMSGSGASAPRNPSTEYTGHSNQAPGGHAPVQGSASVPAQSPSYTEQVQGWTHRVANNLTDQLEDLKGLIGGAGNSTGPTGSQGPADAQHGASRQGNVQPPDAPRAAHDSNGVSQLSPAEPQAGNSQLPPHQQALHCSHATQPCMCDELQTAQSWVDKAREGAISSLTYTQQGLQWTKTSLAGQTQPAGQNTPGRMQSQADNASEGDGHDTAGIGQYTAPAYVPPTAEHPAALSGVNPAYGIVYAASNAGADPNGV